MNTSYKEAVRETQGTHEQAVISELRNLAGILTGDTPAEDQLEVRDRLVALSDLIKAQPRRPTPYQVSDACRLLRSLRRGQRDPVPNAVSSALQLLEG
jgi:hypothetical protein